MRLNPSSIPVETVTVFWRTDAADRTDGVKQDLWHSKTMQAQWRESVDSVNGNGTLSHTTTRKIHLVADGYQPYPAATGWTVRAKDFVAKGEQVAETIQQIKALPNVCSVQAVKPCLNSGMQPGPGVTSWLDSIYVVGV